MPTTRRQVKNSTPRLTDPKDFVTYLRISGRTKTALDALARTNRRTRVAVIRAILEDATGTADD